MTRFGYTLYCEGNEPRDLVRQAMLAEEAGFDFIAISDHYHPWLPNQAHSGFAWSMLGAVAQATAAIELATMVTCPIMRYHPAIVAQAAATIGTLSEGRFSLGLGSGERLNEHVVGQGWPSVRVRHEMFFEAVEVIQKLLQGGYQSYDGNYFVLDDAQVFDLPDEPIPIFMGISGVKSAGLAADLGIGVCITKPNKAAIEYFDWQGGDTDNVWGQAIISWADNEQAGLQNAYEQFRFSAGGWRVQSELPNPASFEAAAKTVRPEDLTKTISCGPDVEKHATAIQKFLDSGVQNISLVYPGTDVEGFFAFWRTELGPRFAAIL